MVFAASRCSLTKLSVSAVAASASNLGTSRVAASVSAVAAAASSSDALRTVVSRSIRELNSGTALSVSAASISSVELPVAPKARPPILNFTDTAEAYKSKSTGELLHALAIFNLLNGKLRALTRRFHFKEFRRLSRRFSFVSLVRSQRNGRRSIIPNPRVE